MFTAAAVACLTINAYHEARGEGAEGIHAVTHVALNRVASPRWPDDPCSVVYDPYAFSWTIEDDLPVDEETLLDVQEHVIDAIMLPDSTYGATHYHADYVSPYWAEIYPITLVVANHIFYKAPKGM